MINQVEKYIAEGIAGLLAVIMGFFWKNQNALDKRIDEVKESASDAHNRITKQGNENNDRFARRDEMTAMENRLSTTINDGFKALREDVRALNSQHHEGG